MFTNSDNPLLVWAFVSIYIPATALFFRYACTTRFWGSPAGTAFFLVLSTSWLNYTVSLASLMFPDWSNSEVGVDIRIFSRLLIGAALFYALWVFEQAQRHPERRGPGGDPRTPSGGVDLSNSGT